MLYNIVSFCCTTKWVSLEYTYIPSLLSLHPRHPTPLDHHRALSWASCVIWQLPRSYLFYTWWYVYWRRQWHPTPVLLPGKSHGWRSLVGCSPWGRWEVDTTAQLHFPFSLSCTGEGNGNPLQCSCLENPRDGRAWWAAIYGVAQSRTWLKWLSSSSIYMSVLLSQFIPPLSSPGGFPGGSDGKESACNTGD